MDLVWWRLTVRLPGSAGSPAFRRVGHHLDTVLRMNDVIVDMHPRPARRREVPCILLLIVEPVDRRRLSAGCCLPGGQRREQPLLLETRDTREGSGAHLNPEMFPVLRGAGDQRCRPPVNFNYSLLNGRLRNDVPSAMTE